jgi:glycosyltransferase involved in cell wall biosynthesis
MQGGITEINDDEINTEKILVNLRENISRNSFANEPASGVQKISNSVTSNENNDNTLSGESVLEWNKCKRQYCGDSNRPYIGKFLIKGRQIYFNYYTRLKKTNNISTELEVGTERKIKLGWISSWNSKCGVATYSKFLLDNIDAKKFELFIFSNTKVDLISFDEDNVIRCWENSYQRNLSDLLFFIEIAKIEVLVIQFQYSFYKLQALEKLITKLQQRNIKIILIFHSTSDVVAGNHRISLKSIVKTLKKVEVLLVHSVTDRKLLNNYGLSENVILFPHGVLNYGHDDSDIIKQKLQLSDKKIIASFGFLLPHKGIKELIKAFHILSQEHPEIHLLLINAIYPAPESVQIRDECIQLIDELNMNHRIKMINEYLTEKESIYLLKCADLIVYPYQTTQESASGAVRHGIASLKPVACTPSPIFEDIKSIVHILPGINPDEIYKGMKTLLENKNLLISKKELQRKWIQEHSWDVLMNRLQEIIQSVVNNQYPNQELDDKCIDKIIIKEKL